MALKKPSITKKDMQNLTRDELTNLNVEYDQRDDKSQPEIRQIRAQLVRELVRVEQEQAQQIYKEEAEGKRPPGQHIRPGG